MKGRAGPGDGLPSDGPAVDGSDPWGSGAEGRPRPLRRYGQHHLIDKGVLRAIVEMAAVRSDDVVLEVGAADGVLTERLAERAAVVHAYEIDGRFAARLQSLVAKRPNLRLYFADALKSPLGRLEPPPTALVANLAYSIAIPLIVTSIARLPGLNRWAVMVQKELAERLFAAPRSKAYAAVSVLVQLAAELEAVRAVPRKAFRPVPNVDSVFITFNRRRDWPADEWPALQSLVRVAFGQRRKMLTNALSGCTYAGRVLSRDEIGAALEELGLPGKVRPEELVPADFLLLARRLARAA